MGFETESVVATLTDRIETGRSMEAALPPCLDVVASHKSGVPSINDFIEIRVVDEPGAGGACHRYQVLVRDDEDVLVDFTSIDFQCGPVSEVGPNGLSIESLLAIVDDRLVGFQDGPYACEENECACICVREALGLLHSRTRRLAGGEPVPGAIVETVNA